MKCLFISDAHYPKSTLLIDFLLDKYEQFDKIFILGDLFEFYYGYKGFFYQHHLKLINVLNMISKRKDLILLEGNHEYNLKAIKQFIDADVVSNYLDIIIDGLKIHMEHGDTIDKKDIAYRLFRYTLKNAITLKLINRIKPSFLFALSEKAAEFSKKRLHSKKHRHTDKALELFAGKKTKDGFDVVILAHTHTPLIKHTDCGLYINSGDFFETFSYVVYTTKDGFSLKYFTGGKNG